MELDSAIFYTRDLNKIISFYTDIIGLTLEAKNGEYYASFIFDNGSKIGIKVADEEREIPGNQTIILSTHKIDEIYSNLKKAEVVFYSDIVDQPWGRHFSVLDPDGNKVEFVQR
jgi:catechol 2,3-dioxygenase-like lactoylglutathione lyase family enzyme